MKIYASGVLRHWGCEGKFEDVDFLVNKTRAYRLSISLSLFLWDLCLCLSVFLCLSPSSPITHDQYRQIGKGTFCDKLPWQIYFGLWTWVSLSFKILSSLLSLCSPATMYLAGFELVNSWELGLQVCATSPGSASLSLSLSLGYWGLNSGPSTWATPPALFVMGIFAIGSCELFAQAGFEPWSSWSLSPE
jgi:hypothetical protein